MFEIIMNSQSKRGDIWNAFQQKQMREVALLRPARGTLLQNLVSPSCCLSGGICSSSCDEELEIFASTLAHVQRIRGGQQRLFSSTFKT